MEQRLDALAEASSRIFGAGSLAETLRLAAEEARAIIGAHQSVTSLTIGPEMGQSIQAVSLSDKYAAWRSYEEAPAGKGVIGALCRDNRPMRLTQAELEAHPDWRGFGPAKDRHPPMRGWLAAPLVARDGTNLGLIQLSDKYEGEFDPGDEAVLVQIARLTSLAVENTRLVEAAQAAERRFQDFASCGSDVLWETDAQHRYTFVSARAGHRTFRPVADSYGLTRWEQFGASRDDPVWAAHIADLEAHRPFQNFEYSYAGGDGSIQYRRASGHPVFGDDGAFLGYRGATSDVTALRRAEASARASEQRFREFAAIASDWIWETGVDHRFTFFSGAAGTLDHRPYGATRWDVARADLAAPKWQAHLADLQARRSFRDFEYPRLDETGRLRTISVSGNPVFAADGSFRGYRGTARDVTAQREAEAAAREADARYRNIVEATNEGIWILDADARTSFVNRQMAAMLGYAAEELVGRSVYDFRVKEDLSAVSVRWRERAEGVAEQREARFRRRDGSLFWAMINAQPLYDTAGNFAGSIGMVSDITARKNAESALIESEERFRQFSALGSDWLWETDAEHRITLMDGPAPIAAGFELGKRRWEYGGVDPDRPEWQALRRDLDRHLPFRNREYMVLDASGGQRHFSITGRPMFDAAGAFLGYRGTTTDITPRRSAEVALRASESRFRDYAEVGSDWLWETDAEDRFILIEGPPPAIPGPVIGRTRCDYAGADPNDPHWRAHLDDVAARRAFRNFEYRSADATGRIRYIQVSGKPVFGEDGVFKGYRGTSSDVTARREAEAKAHASEEKFRDFAEVASDWLWETDAAHRLTFISGMAVPLLDKAIGRTIWQLAGASPDEPGWRDHVAALDARRPFRDFEYRLAFGGQTYHLESSGKPVFGADGSFAGYRGTTADRTKERRAEAAARETAEKYRLIVETANEGIWLRDANGILTYANEAFAQMMGYRVDEMIGFSIFDVKPRGTEAESLRLWEAHKSLPRERFETAYRRKDGSEISVLLSSTSIYDAAGGFVGKLGMVADITDLKRTQAALIDSERRFRDFADVSSDWFWETDSRHRFTYFSPSRGNTQRDPSEAAIGQTRWQYAGADPDEAGWRAHVADLDARRHVRNFEYRYTRVDGSHGVTVVNGLPVFGPTGEFLGYRGTATDITERRAAEAAARASEQKFQRIIETANEGVWILDRDSRIVFANRRLEEILGYESGGLVGKSVLDTVPVDRLEEVRRHLAERSQGRVGRFEARHLRKDGSEVILLVSTTPVFDEGGAFAGSTVMLVDITERKAAEAAAAQAKRELDTILASTSDGVAAFDNEWRYTFLNPPGERITGLKAAEIVGTNGFEKFAVGPHNIFFQVYLEAKRDMQPVSFSAYSELFGAWHEVRAFPHTDGLTAFFRDITAERLGHLALAQSERKLRAALENNQSILASISDGFAAFDNDWRFTFVNEAAEKIWQRRAEDLIGSRTFDAFEVDRGNPFQSCYMESKQSGEPVAFTAYSQNFGRWLEVRGYPHATGYTIFFHDVSEERESHRALLDSARALDAARDMNERLFETSSDIICIADRRGNLLQVNPGTLAQFGRPLAAMIGRNAAEFIVADDLDRTRAALKAARRAPGRHTFENRCVRADGTTFPMSWAVAWSEGEGRYYLIGRDMTERIEAEDRMRRAHRLQAIGQLTGGIAHDFNNLLTVIMGNSEMLARALKDQDRLRRHAELSLTASRRAAELTAQLLAFARRQALAPDAVDPNELLGGIRALLERSLGAQIAIEFALDPAPWRCKVDPTQLETALLNLAVNARDAMPRGGRLVISTSKRKVAPGSALDLAPGDYVVIDVTDTGEGMEEAVAARAFEPFFTTKDIGKGSGLGLAMVYGFAKQSGGLVGIASAPGMGTTVTLHLPRAADGQGEARSRDVAPEAGALVGGAETILVVEDDAAVRSLVTDELARLGYRVITAESGASARAVLASATAVDLLFSDVMMPGGVNGVQLAREAIADRPALKVLLTSGYSEIPEPDGGAGGRRPALLRKPYRISDLAGAVRDALDAAR